MNNQRIIDFRFAPAQTWTSICRPDDPYKTLVREDGALLYRFVANTFESWYFERVVEFSLHTAQKPVKFRQQTESARVPVVITTIEYPSATLELKTFGHVHDGEHRTDIVLWSIRAHDNVDEILTAIHVDLYERQRVFVGRSEAPARTIFAVDPSLLPPPNPMALATQQMIEDESQPGQGELVFISSPQRMKKAHGGGFRPCSGLAMEPVILRAGERVSGTFVFPLNHSDDAGIGYEWALKALDRERAYWQALSLPALRIQVPDPDLMDMLTACARNILQAREIEDGLPVFKVGPTIYRNLFVIDGHFMLECAQYLGYAQEASAAINTLLRRVRPNGAIAEMEFHRKETGISIATLIRQCELLGDDERLRNLWSIIRNGVAYIEGLREQAHALPPDDPCANLLPGSFGDGGIGGERGEYTTTVWILAGLKAAADAASRLGFIEDSARFRTNYESLMVDFRAHAVRNMRKLPDGTPYLPQCFAGSGEHHWIPDYSGTVEPWHRLQPGSGTWALCQAIWPGEVFSPDDPIVQNLNHLHDLLDDEEGIPASTGWLPYRALWSYHASFAAHAWLYCNRADKAIDYLYAFANHASATRVWREEQALTGSGNGLLVGDMPHNWASAEFIRLLRHLLVFERGETLELLPGLPEDWIKPGMVVRLDRTPTRFGSVTLEVTSPDGSELNIVVGFTPGWQRRATRCVLHLPGSSAVTVNGQPKTVDSRGTIDLPVEGQVRITARRTAITEIAR